MENTKKATTTAATAEAGEGTKKANAKKDTHKTYEEWKVDVLRSHDGNKTEVKLDKVRLLKTVTLEPRRAEALNRRSADTKIHYYETN